MAAVANAIDHTTNRPVNHGVGINRFGVDIILAHNVPRRVQARQFATFSSAQRTGCAELIRHQIPCPEHDDTREHE